MNEDKLDKEEIFEISWMGVMGIHKAECQEALVSANSDLDNCIVV